MGMQGEAVYLFNSASIALRESDYLLLYLKILEFMNLFVTGGAGGPQTSRHMITALTCDVGDVLV